jgi:hypothetical protein
MQVVHGKSTFVYKDASVGSHNQSMTGGLGVAITRLYPENGEEHARVSASAGSSTAQINYHIATLEASHLCGLVVASMNGCQHSLLRGVQTREGISLSRIQSYRTIGRCVNIHWCYRRTDTQLNGSQRLC